MPIKHNRDNGILDIQFEGRFDGLGAPELQLELNSVVEEDDRAVVLNMRRLEYINSAGMRAILGLLKRLERQEARLAVYSLVGPAKDVFQISGFDRIITVRASKTEAIAAVID